jgi:streptogramin lyase
VDLGQFESLLAEGTDALASGNAGRASERLREALDLCRGEPFADLDSVGFVQIERVRIEELRLSAVEERLDADLALGRHAEIVAELHALVREHPLRERLRAQLMLALYRAGRQAEALDVYQQGRRLLAEELGLEPGEALKRLEHSILEQDPGLGAPVRATRRRAPARATTRRSRRTSATVLAVVLLSAIAIVVAVMTTSGGRAFPAVRADSLAVIDTHTNHLAGDVPIDGLPVAVAAGSNGVYVASEREGIVWLVDSAKREIVRKIGVGADVHDLALGFGSVWLADGTDGTLTRIDDQLRGIQARIPLGNDDAPAFWVATDRTGVWVTHGRYIEKIDPATNRVSKAIPVPQPSGLTAGPRGVFVTSGERVVGFPLSTRDVRRTYGQLPGPVAAPTESRGGVWSIAYNGDGEVWRFGKDLGTAGIVSGSEGRYPLDLTLGDGAAWTVDTRGRVSRIDPAAMQVVRTIRTAPTIRSSLAFASGDLWVAIQGPG